MANLAKSFSKLLASSAVIVALCAPAAALDLNVGGSNGISASVDVGTSNGLSADVDASVGGSNGVNASADARIGGSNGISADVDASVVNPARWRASTMSAAPRIDEEGR